MTSSFALMIGLITCTTVYAGNVGDSFQQGPGDKSWVSDEARFVNGIRRQSPRALKFDAAFTAPAAGKAERSIAGAWKKGFVEEGVEASRNVLIECQNATSVVLTTPFMRSDSQQNHCYRF
jgi:hypothetical protein